MNAIWIERLLAVSSSAMAQADRHDVRKGNREFRREEYKAADVDYRKALLRDSTSFAANYNLANTLYRISGGQEAKGTQFIAAPHLPNFFRLGKGERQ